MIQAEEVYSTGFVRDSEPRTIPRSPASNMASACVRRVVKTVHISSIIPNLANDLVKRFPRITFINVPVGCSGGKLA